MAAADGRRSEDRTYLFASRSRDSGDRSSPRVYGGHTRPERFRQGTGAGVQPVGAVNRPRVSMRREAPLKFFSGTSFPTSENGRFVKFRPPWVSVALFRATPADDGAISPWEAYTVRRRLHMGAAVAISIFFALFVAIFLPLIMSGKQWRAEQDRARARRMAEHRMNARLLRLNI